MTLWRWALEDNRTALAWWSVPWLVLSFCFSYCQKIPRKEQGCVMELYSALYPPSPFLFDGLNSELKRYTLCCALINSPLWMKIKPTILCTLLTMCKSKLIDTAPINNDWKWQLSEISIWCSLNYLRPVIQGVVNEGVIGSYGRGKPLKSGLQKKRLSTVMNVGHLCFGSTQSWAHNYCGYAGRVCMYSMSKMRDDLWLV